MRFRKLVVAATLVLGSALPRSSQAADIFYDFNVSNGGWTNEAGTTQLFAWNATSGIGGQGVWQINGADNTFAELNSPDMIATATSITITLLHRFRFESVSDGAAILGYYPSENRVNLTGTGACI